MRESYQTESISSTSSVERHLTHGYIIMFFKVTPINNLVPRKRPGGLENTKDLATCGLQTAGHSNDPIDRILILGNWRGNLYKSV